MNEETRQPTTVKLAEALKQEGAPKWMIVNAQSGLYDDFKSVLAMPLHQLVNDAREAGLSESFVGRVINDGEFDAQEWESDDWEKSEEGQAIFKELMEQKRTGQ